VAVDTRWQNGLSQLLVDRYRDISMFLKRQDAVSRRGRFMETASERSPSRGVSITISIAIAVVPSGAAPKYRRFGASLELRAVPDDVADHVASIGETEEGKRRARETKREEGSA